MRELFLALVVTLPGCWHSSSDSVTTVWGTQTSGSGVNTAGGGIIQVTGLTVPAFVFEEPVPFQEVLPAPDALAMAEVESLVAPGVEVIDALLGVDGLLALVLEPEGMILALLAVDPVRSSAAPSDALRLLPAGDDPLRVLVVLRDGQAVLATRTSSE